MAPNVISLSSTPRATSVSPSVVVIDKRQKARQSKPLDVINISSTPLTNLEPSSPPSPTPASEKYHSSAQARSTTSPTPERKYRDAASLPFELKEHCLIYLEEGLYAQALNFLLSLVTSGALPPSWLAATIAPPSFLALIATLTVHPTCTTRAKSNDRRQASVLASRYLRMLLENVGSINSNFIEAFTFGDGNAAGRSTRKGGRRRTAEISDSGIEKIDADIVSEGSLWTNAEDFWHVVGWTFNCSVLHKRRWEVWRQWLEFMLDTLEADWVQRDTEDLKGLPESLMASFLRDGRATGGSGKRVLRAIFADGQARAAHEFGEVWRNEPRELKKEGGEKKKVEQKIDIEADDYGDYLDEENDADLEDESESTPSHATSRRGAHVKGASVEGSNAGTILGGMDAIHLRFRLLAILSSVCASIPDFFMSTRMLYDLLLEHVRPLPSPTFFLIMSPSGLRHFQLSGQSSFTQFALLTFIDPRAPQPPNDTLNQERLETHYLPWAANVASPKENAQVSLCVETLLRLLDREDALEGTDSLMKTAERGIEARFDKCRGRGGRIQGSNGPKGDDMIQLEQSAVRIRWLVKMAISRTKREKEDQDNQIIIMDD